MRTIIKAATIGLALATPMAAQSAVSDQEVAELRQQLQALLARVQQLEARNSAPTAAAAAPAGSSMAALEGRVAQVEAAGDRQAGQLAQVVSRDKGADWAGRLKWKGDFRYRHEQFDIEGVSPDRVRHRIRARLGLDAAISDTLKAGFRLATGDIDDPRSGNATLDDANRHKQVALDLAYVDWRAFEGGVLTLGKQYRPWFESGNGLFYDDDVNPEGVALKWAGRSGVFANAWGFWLEEQSSQADSTLVGAQAGWASEPLGLRLAAGYWDYGTVRNRPVLNFAGAPAGNSVYASGTNCSGTGTTRCYVHDFDIVALDAQWSGKVGNLPLTLFAAWLRNLDPGDQDTGYNAGFQLGKAGDPGSWQLGALYQEMERDAQFGALLDADFAGGVTQSRGLQLQGAWAPIRNVSLKATLFLNDVNYDTPSETDYKRLQLDMNYKF